MFLITILILPISLGSVMLDSNIQELCSKKYFDTIAVTKSTIHGTTVLLKSSDSKRKTVHSWSVPIEEQNGNFKPLTISYIPNGVKSYPPTHFSQPKGCPIDVTTIWTLDDIKFSHTTKWEINDFFIANTKGKIEVQYAGLTLDVKDFGEKNKPQFSEKESYELKNAYIESSQLSGISMIAILCKESDKSLYAIVEEEPPNASNRRQFVARIRAENYKVWHTFGEKGKDYKVHRFQSDQRFWFELMNHSIVDFLGIDCEEGFEEDSEFLSDDTLFVMFWVLLGIGIILFIADTGLIIKREPPKPRPTYRRTSRFGPLLDLMENKR